MEGDPGIDGLTGGGPAGRRVAGRAALVSGAASGIGRACALLLAREGARVLCTDLDDDGAAAAAAAIRAAGGDAASLRVDVREERDWEAACEDAVSRFGGLHVLVASAGISFARPVAEMTLEEWRHVHAVNLDGVFLGTKHAVRRMKTGGGGSIVIVSSASGLKASPGVSAYASSKAALRLFAKAVALEHAGDRIRVNTVHPAGVVTPMWETMPFFQELVREHGEEGAWRALAADSPFGRFATADEVAAAVLFLASDDASYVTGTELAVDGGYTA